MSEKRHPKQREPKTPQADAIFKRGLHDDASIRAKSSGHGKKTADKWNQ